MVPLLKLQRYALHESPMLTSWQVLPLTAPLLVLEPVLWLIFDYVLRVGDKVTVITF